VIVILRPKGRGNWRPVTMAIEGSRVSPLLIRRGQLVPLGGVVFKVSRVLA